jgi:glycosyltransferase involved in cell wall biosynthesis
MAPEFSVVIPLYNKRNEIARCLESVLAQTRESYEVVVIDDGSTDDGAALVVEFASPRIRLIRQENRGLGPTRNRGIEESNADVIAFLDADDEWLPGHLEQIHKLAAAAPSAGVYCTAFWLDQGGGMRRRVRLPGRFVTPGRLIRDYYSMPNGKTLPSAMAARKSVLLEAGGFRKMFGEDIDLLLRLAAMRPIAYGDEATAIWHLDAQNRMCVDEKATVKLYEPGSLQKSLDFVERFDGASASVRRSARQYVQGRERRAILGTLFTGQRAHAKTLYKMWCEEFQTTDKSLEKLLDAPSGVLKIYSWQQKLSTKATTAWSYAQEWRVNRTAFENR